MLTFVIYLILVCLTLLAIQVFHKPGIAAALVWGMIVMESVVQQRNQFLLTHPTFINYLIAGIATVAAVWAIISLKYRGIRVPVQVWLYAALIGMCMLSYFWSRSPAITYQQLSLNMPYILAFGFLAPMCLYDEKQLAAAMKTTMYFGGLVVLGLALSTIGRRGIILTTERGMDVEANPLAAASYAGYVAFACLFSVWGNKLFTINSIVKLAIIFCCMVALIKSGSRGQLITFAGVSILLIPIMAKAAARRSTILSMIGAALLTGLVIILVDKLGWSYRWKVEHLIMAHQGRLDMAGYMLRANYEAGPLAWMFGLGSSSSWKIIGGYPHNAVAETMAEEGLVGVTILLVIIILCARQGIQLMISSDLSKQTRVNIATLMAFFSFNFILSFKEGSLLGSSMSVFCTGLTIAWLHSRLYKKSPTTRSLINRAAYPENM